MRRTSLVPPWDPHQLRHTTATTEARGVKYATARSWRHRAVQGIQEYEKGRRKEASGESPS